MKLVPKISMQFLSYVACMAILTAAMLFLAERRGLIVFQYDYLASAARTPRLEEERNRREVVVEPGTQLYSLIEGGSLSSPSLPSLEMAEHVDFIFAPGLYVERLAEEDCVVSYPAH